MAKSIDNELTEQLFEAILSLENKEECYRFFKDLATVSEIVELSHRLEVARMLKMNYTYNEIVDKTGVSTTTVSRVKRALEYGEDGYNLILERLGYTEEK
ncbi:MAG: YerC/YecD family TrpR-related protein [Halanaerobiaceae bacterium]